MVKKFLDVKNILANKNKNLVKYMPGFVLRYLERILHEDELNAFVEKYKDHKNYDFIEGVIKEFDITINVTGLDNVPQEHPVIFVSNHPLGGMDAMAVIYSLKNVRPDIKFIVNDFLTNIPNLQEMFIGINKVGVISKSALMEVNELFKSNSAVYIFPAGMVSRIQNNEVVDLTWKKTFVTQAKKNQRLVQPIFIEGGLSGFFYRLSKFRQFLGIKVNFEMAYLVDEMYRQKGKTIDIVFDEPINYTSFDKTKNDKQWAESVKERIYTLRKR